MDTTVISSSTDCVHVDKKHKRMPIISKDPEQSPDDNPPELHIFEEQCDVIAALDHTSTAFDYFPIFMPLEIINNQN